jgi:hypothetical protein
MSRLAVIVLCLAVLAQARAAGELDENIMICIKTYVWW